MASTGSQRDKLLILAVFLLAVGGVVVFQLAGGDADPPAGRPPVIATQPREFLGVALQLAHPEATHPHEQMIREIAGVEADTVALVVRGHQEDASATSIMVDLRKNPSDERLRETIRYARSEDAERGKPAMKVVLMPIVLLENPERDEWRGTIMPEDWGDWWEDYTAFILHYAKIAQETGVDVLMVGSELVSTEKSQAHRWERLIAEVREVYDGRLAYSSNWDHYKAIPWWDKLDIIGMTTYYDLTGGKEPTLDRLRAAWGPIKRDILEWRNENHPHHKILFTEVGWPNQETCAEFPWDYYRAVDKPAPEVQADCFQAFFETWKDEPAVAGYLVWEWRTAPWHGTDPAEDTTYVPAGKPAEEVIRQHYRAVKERREAAEAEPETRPAG